MIFPDPDQTFLVCAIVNKKVTILPQIHVNFLIFSLIKLVNVEHTEHTVWRLQSAASDFFSREIGLVQPTRNLAGQASFKMPGLGWQVDSQWLSVAP